MSIRIVRGKIRKSQRVILCGPEHSGKTSLAAQWPNPLFIDVEGGSFFLDVPRAVAKTWPDVVDVIHELTADAKAGKAQFGTLVIDTIDAAERMAVEDMLARDKKQGIEDYGYGKGYVALAERINAFLLSLTALAEAGINIVLCAHTQLRKVELPDQDGAYDHYELKMSRHASPLVREWADAMLFVTWDVAVIENSDGKTKARGGRDRVIHTAHTAAWDAKNRLGMPTSIPAPSPEEAWDAIKPYIIGGGIPESVADAGAAETAEAEKVRVNAIMEDLGAKLQAAGFGFNDLNAFLESTKRPLTIETKAKCLANIDAVLAALRKVKAAKVEKTMNKKTEKEA